MSPESPITPSRCLTPLTIGDCRLPNRLALAPMAGITDQPFRRLALAFGAGLAVSEMIAANPELRTTRKSRLRSRHTGMPHPVAVQIVGNDPAVMADAARYNVELGAEIIDINMGCPAKKVCRKAAGSALLADEALVGRILDAVVNAVSAPVTLKIRTGIDHANRNAVAIARIAQSAGIRMLTVHGRTRADRFTGSADYDTIAQVCDAVDIPVLANGDIDSPERARQVLERTGAAGVMIGRAARGRPWIFREISRHLATGAPPSAPRRDQIIDIAQQHLRGLYALYGEQAGVRIARKHIGWYLGQLGAPPEWRRRINRLTSASDQLDALDSLRLIRRLSGTTLRTPAIATEKNR